MKPNATVSSFCIFLLHSDFRLEAAGAGEAPAAQGFVNCEQTGDDKNQAEPQFVIHEHDARDEAQRADDAARDAPVASDVGAEEITHDGNLAQAISVASGARLRRVSHEFAGRTFSVGVARLGRGGQRLFHLWLAAALVDSAGWRRGDDGSLVFSPRTADDACVSRADVCGLLVVQAGVLKFFSGVKPFANARMIG